MLLEVGMMFTAYCGMRVYEKYRKPINKRTNSACIKTSKSHQIVRSLCLWLAV